MASTRCHFYSKSKFKLIDLPNEMIERISTFLDARSLICLGRTCKALESVANIDTLWHNLCQEDYGIFHKKGWNLTYRQIYTKILRPYPILGFKRLALLPYGGLLHIMWAESEIKVNRIYPGDSYTEPLVMEPAFSLTWNQKTKNLDVKCVHNPEEEAPATILKDGPYFMLQCQNKKCFRSHKRSSYLLGQANSIYTDPEFPKGFTDHIGVFKAFKFSNGYNCPILPLEFCPTPIHFPVTPGLYKAHYGPHGIEIIQIRVNESNSDVLEGVKLVGDVNVPAGNFSFTVFLDKPILMTEEEQEMDMSEMMEADELRPQEEYQKLLQTREKGSWDQPFVLPPGRFQEGNCPSLCVARYLGEGRIAGECYTNPSQTKIHMIKFDDDTFGIFWLKFAYLIMFEREKDILKQMEDMGAESK